MVDGMNEDHHHSFTFLCRIKILDAGTVRKRRDNILFSPRRISSRGRYQHRQVHTTYLWYGTLQSEYLLTTYSIILLFFMQDFISWDGSGRRDFIRLGTHPYWEVIARFKLTLAIPNRTPPCQCQLRPSPTRESRIHSGIIVPSSRRSPLQSPASTPTHF